MQASAKAEQPLARVRAQHPHDEQRRGHANAGEEPALPATGEARKENAAPVLCTRTMLKKLVT
jgi:hypothetical protein